VVACPASSKVKERPQQFDAHRLKHKGTDQKTPNKTKKKTIRRLITSESKPKLK
jgi:hypothetical protein